MKTKILVLVLLSALFMGCIQTEEPIGGERDEHGCLGPAGYTWDEDTGACVREWEIDENQKRAAKIAVAPLSYSVTVVDVAVARCPGCFSVRLQRNDNQEELTITLENWEILEEPVGCPEDARICHDGTVVVREGPDCEFAPCPSQGMTEELCSSASGNWNECSSRCRLANQGRDDITCIAVCESLCECAGIAGFACPEGYTCEAPSGIADALGYCVKTEEPASDTSVVEANNEFALDLYQELRDSDGNIFYSPWSIISALAMTYEGARGQTANEMQEVLHLPKEGETRRDSFKEIQNGINREDKDYELYTANALWPQKDYPFLESYIDTIRTYYGGEVTALDYVTETEKSRQTINSWVEEQTRDKIKDIISPGVLGPLTRLVLTNAIYFKGTWVMQFDEEDTTDQDFYVSPAEKVTVPMMSLTGDEAMFNYAEDEDVQVLELPYDGEEVSMLVILPKENALEEVEESLSTEKLNQWRNDLQEQEVHVFLPRFKLETKYFLPNVLKEMGMVAAFGSNADFSGMDGTKDLFISDVIHQAFVEVNEEGTEAAAATAVVMTMTAMPSYKTFRADHPFVFIIQEKETGNILFMGRVTDPS